MDQFWKGAGVTVGKTNSHICPVKAVSSYLAIRGFSPGPFFRNRDGLALTRQQLVAQLRATLAEEGVDCTRYSGHSFRIGAASIAAAEGLADSTIHKLGR